MNSSQSRKESYYIIIPNVENIYIYFIYLRRLARFIPLIFHRLSNSLIMNHYRYLLLFIVIRFHLIYLFESYVYYSSFCAPLEIYYFPVTICFLFSLFFKAFRTK